MNSTISHNALQCAPVLKIESELSAPDLLARLERYSSHAGCGIELLELLIALASAPDDLRRDVVTLARVGLAEYDASIEDNA